MIASATAGAWLGAGMVSRLPRRTIQLFMGVALLIAAFFFAIKNLGAFPPGGVRWALPAGALALRFGCNFVFGALMCIGIGNYAPSMILLALLGMHPLAAFPIMMEATAFCSRWRVWGSSAPGDSPTRPHSAWLWAAPRGAGRLLHRQAVATHRHALARDRGRYLRGTDDAAIRATHARAGAAGPRMRIPIGRSV